MCRVSDMGFKHQFIAALLAVSLPLSAAGQEASCDTVRTGGNYKFEWRQTVLPASLITAGAVCLAPSFIRNGSRAATEGIIDIRGSDKRLEFDDYVQYAPVIGALALGCTGVKARHTLGERTLILATSYATLAVLTNVPKYFIDEKRPEFAGHNSFPSGHTATAFMGAELVRIEYGGWYGFGAYTVATGIGFMRMYNGRHWLHDVVAGAGVGILSARVGEWSCGLWQRLLHKRKRSTSDFVFTPIASPLDGGYYGFAAGCRF